MGCGFGRILKEIAVALGKKGKVTGIEIDDFALEESVKVAEIIKMDALNMGFRDGSFDGVLLLWNIFRNLEKEEKNPSFKGSKKGIYVGGK